MRSRLWTLAALILWLGVYPQPVIALLEPSLAPLAAEAPAARWSCCGK